MKSTRFTRRAFGAAPLVALLAVNLSVAQMPTLGDCVNPTVSNAPLKRVQEELPPSISSPGANKAVGELSIQVDLIERLEQWYHLRVSGANFASNGTAYRASGKLQTFQQQERVKFTRTFHVRVDLQFLPERYTPRLTKPQSEELLAVLEKHGAKAFQEAYGTGIVDSVTRGGGIDLVYQFVFSDEQSLQRAEAEVSAAVRGLGKGGVSVEDVARKHDKQAELHIHIIQRGGLIDQSTIEAITGDPDNKDKKNTEDKKTNGPGHLEEVVKKIKEALRVVTRETVRRPATP